MANINIEVKDYSAEYLKEMESTVRKGVVDIGNDVQSVARQAAPEKTQNLLRHITVSTSFSSGAYQAEIESTAVDPVTGHDYVDWMHNGRYRLGPTSRAKGMASSRIGNFRKRVGRNYLQGIGDIGKKGYQNYMETQVSDLNSKYGQ